MSEDLHRDGEGWKQRRVFLFSHARTMSSLLTRIVSGQPEWEIHDYQFQDAFMELSNVVRQQPASDLSTDCLEQYHSHVCQGRRSLDTVVEDAATNKHHIFVKNHTYHICPPEVIFGAEHFGARGKAQDHRQPAARAISSTGNPTFFHDELMESWTPVILLRHPAAAFESWYRAEGEPELGSIGPMARVFTTYRLSRQVFDWYKSRSQSRAERGQPCVKTIVLDADDILDRKDILERFATEIGMHVHCLKLEWDAISPTEFPGCSDRHKRFQSSLWSSTSIDRSKSSRRVDLTDKEEEWKTRFGIEAAAFLTARARDALVDYNYLMASKIQ